MRKQVHRNGAVRFIVPSKASGPSDVSAEAAALGCVLAAGEAGTQAEVDEMIRKLRLSWFTEDRHKSLLRAFFSLRQDGHAVDVVTLSAAARAAGGMDEIGGMDYVASLPDRVPSWLNFPHYVSILSDQAHRRWLKAKAVELETLAGAPEVTIEQTRERLAEVLDVAQRVSGQPLIDLVTPAEAREFVPDPSDYLVGDGLISREAVVTIGGEPGCGKSRLATTLAVSLASGGGTWQGYPVRSQVRSLILQTENKGTRLRDEFSAVPSACDDWIRISRSLPNGLAFGNADFRRELGRLFDRWPFGLLVVDPWNDVVTEEGASEYGEALLNIQRCFTGKKCPAIVIVAHLRKPRADGSGRRKTGRELLHELSGSLKLGSTSRTVFTVQPASPEMEDDRIVFEIAKANDCDPAWLGKYGTRSAWHRKNGAFTPAGGFDWETWLNPGPANSEKRAVSEEMVREVFAVSGRKGMKAGELVRAIVERFDVGASTVWRAVGAGGYARAWLDETAGVMAPK